jgi:tetratricopeptide (TPR) repeat protein
MISARLKQALISAGLAAAILAVFAPLAHSDFISLDDAEYVRENPNINAGLTWHGLKWAMVNPVVGNWHPVTMLSHMLDCQLYGVHSGPQHLTNVFLHALNAVILFWVLLRLCRAGTAASTPSGGRDVVWPAAWVAALFGLHPLHVESVAWISERKDLLSGFFFFLTLGAYASYVSKVKNGRNGWTWYVLAIICLALGLMSKPMLVTVPFVLLLLDFWPLNRWGEKKERRRIILEKLPFLGLAIVFSIVAFVVQKKAGAVVAVESFPLPARLATAMVSYAHYLGKTFWPDSLIMLYPLLPWTTGQVIGATVLFFGLCAGAIAAARRKPYLFVGWLIFAGMLVPVIGLVQVGQTAMADHYTYLPLIGIFLGIAWLVRDLAISPALRLGAAALAILSLVLMGAATARQVQYWKDSRTLFGYAVQVTDNNPVAHYILGALLDAEGREDAALNEFSAAVRYNPANVKALCGEGHILCDQGRFDEASERYQTALHFEPNSAKAHFGLGEVLVKERRADEAMEQYFLALNSNPNIAQAHYRLAELYSAKQDMAATIAHLQEALKTDPNYVMALNNLAWILATQKDPRWRDGAEAVRLAQHAVVLTGNGNPSTLDTLSAAYAEAGQFDEAITAAQTAVARAQDAGQDGLAREIGGRLASYKAHRAWRE